ncbi:MAG: hypothetical protein ACFFD4_18970 [Candidatus Odinarchaeota archaeon]
MALGLSFYSFHRCSGSQVSQRGLLLKAFAAGAGKPVSSISTPLTLITAGFRQDPNRRPVKNARRGKNIATSYTG